MIQVCRSSGIEYKGLLSTTVEQEGERDWDTNCIRKRELWKEEKELREGRDIQKNRARERNGKDKSRKRDDMELNSCCLKSSSIISKHLRFTH